MNGNTCDFTGFRHPPTTAQDTRHATPVRTFIVVPPHCLTLSLACHLASSVTEHPAKSSRCSSAFQDSMTEALCFMKRHQ
ncbi:hypothetical protein E2C01_016477 [Portunus trituberculatus]|uniref:Uncharacterized protein n=1 Tax=Portunus trituberculatus TaxID=210409 RepID=A0A5B7DPH7_PORTR|nr:hypothetical protein [Portunus trituberculatus]